MGLLREGINRKLHSYPALFSGRAKEDCLRETHRLSLPYENILFNYESEVASANFQISCRPAIPKYCRPYNQG